MNRSPLLRHIDTLPELVREILDDINQSINQSFPPPICRHIERVFIVGCGDSHHAGVSAELAFERLAGLPCEPMNAMQFSRYAVPYLPASNPAGFLILGISVSGSVSRTIEAIDLARQIGAQTVAITGNRQTPITQAANSALITAVPALPDDIAGQVVPGIRSYFASLCALYLLAIHIGQYREHLTSDQATDLHQRLNDMAKFIETAIQGFESKAKLLNQNWGHVDQFVYCGSGPNYGTAMFCAAKMLEASGDSAIAQDIEEWAHLQYFARTQETPTILLSGGISDMGRSSEVASAALRIGRRVSIICPEDSQLAQIPGLEEVFLIPGSVKEYFTPLLTCIPGALIAAYRSEILGEPYFQGFSGGRSIEGGGGISRIRTSERLTKLQVKDPI